MSHGGAVADRLAPGCNEWYLFHGTNEKSAQSICRHGFRLSLAGGSTGTLYGCGAYLSEAIRVADVLIVLPLYAMILAAACQECFLPMCPQIVLRG